MVPPEASPLTPEEEEALKKMRQRRRDRRPKPEQPKLNMTPMIDVVFLLIIFFMLVSEFQRMELEVIMLPFALEAKEEAKDQQERIIINVNEKGVIKVAGRKYEPEELQEELKRRAQASRKDAQGLPVLAVKIRGDARCEYKYVQDAMVQAMRAYIWKMSFGVSPMEEQGK
jgi:biopolymer transport protein ExbD